MEQLQRLSIQPIIDQSVDDEIDYGVAFDMIKALPKPWHRPEWKVLRDQVIKDHCEKCNTKAGPMVIQHTRHPEKFSLLKA